MEIFFTAVAAAIIGYVIIIIYTYGFLPFLLFFLLMAAANAGLAILTRWIRRTIREKKDVPIFPCTFAYTTAAAAFLILFLQSLVLAFNARSEYRPNLDYVIVMGKDLSGSRIPRSLQRRLDSAVRYYEKNEHTIFVLSGGNGRSRAYALEATAMYSYMIRHGVPQENLIMEFYSKSTMEKVGFSIQAIQQDVEDRQRREEESGALRFGETVPPTDNGEGILKGEDKPLSVGIITSSCNMYHAERLAEKFGLTDVCPMAVNTSEILLFYNYAEEALDVFKDKLVGNL